jgi:hypothetical protein
MENDEGDVVLRAYQSQHDKPITQNEIKELSELYTKLNGPKIPLCAPPDWDDELMEMLGTQYVETPITFLPSKLNACPIAR